MVRTRDNNKTHPHMRSHSRLPLLGALCGFRMMKIVAGFLLAICLFVGPLLAYSLDDDLTWESDDEPFVTFGSTPPPEEQNTTTRRDEIVAPTTPEAQSTKTLSENTTLASGGGYSTLATDIPEKMTSERSIASNDSTPTFEGSVQTESSLTGPNVGLKAGDVHLEHLSTAALEIPADDHTVSSSAEEITSDVSNTTEHLSTISDETPASDMETSTTTTMPLQTTTDAPIASSKTEEISSDALTTAATTAATTAGGLAESSEPTVTLNETENSTELLERLPPREPDTKIQILEDKMKPENDHDCEDYNNNDYFYNNMQYDNDLFKVVDIQEANYAGFIESFPKRQIMPAGRDDAFDYIFDDENSVDDDEANSDNAEDDDDVVDDGDGEVVVLESQESEDGSDTE